MKYTIKDLKKDFPDNDACLEYIFNNKYPNVKGYYRIKGRKCYSHKTTRHQIHPLADTIFEKSSTPLTDWFHAIFLFSASKNGVAAKELERQLGVTYKCAWRMANKIRRLMKDGGDVLSGVVEVDETYFGGKVKGHETKFKSKSAVMGMVERDGRIRARKIPDRQTHTILDILQKNVSKKTHLMTDEFSAYDKAPMLGYSRSSIKHGKKRYGRGIVHTNTIEGFWGQLKRSISGTYHSVSPQHLQSYVDEFSFRYNLRLSSVPVFEKILERI